MVSPVASSESGIRKGTWDYLLGIALLLSLALYEDVSYFLSSIFDEDS